MLTIHLCRRPVNGRGTLSFYKKMPFIAVQTARIIEMRSETARCAGTLEPTADKGVLVMSSRHSMMSEELKYEIAKELGVDDRVRNEGWGSVSSRDCGNMVRKAIELAERGISK
jgi:small acid-soluble spore protein F (minor alpha/beta-type SASP)